MYEISSKLTVKTPSWRRPGVFIVVFGQISIIVLVLLLLTLIKYIPAWNAIPYLLGHISVYL